MSPLNLQSASDLCPIAAPFQEESGLLLALLPIEFPLWYPAFPDVDEFIIETISKDPEALEVFQV